MKTYSKAKAYLSVATVVALFSAALEFGPQLFGQTSFSSGALGYAVALINLVLAVWHWLKSLNSTDILQ